MAEVNPVAIYAAVVSTATAAWQVYTYFRDGARLRLTTGGNRVLAGEGYDISKNFIVVNAVNVGNRATTIQVIGMYAYDNWWKRFRRRSTNAYVIKVASPGNV